MQKEFPHSFVRVLGMDSEKPKDAVTEVTQARNWRRRLIIHINQAIHVNQAGRGMQADEEIAHEGPQVRGALFGQ
jgi:hypothetical protein